MTIVDRSVAFVDTNTLLHFKPLENLNWLEKLETERATIILLRTVLREVDKQKYAHPRKKIRERAARVTARLSKLLDRGSEREIRKGVTLRFEAGEPTIEFARYGLDRDVTDDRILASAIEFRRDNPVARVVVITNDVGFKSLLRLHDFAVKSLPDEDKLPEEPDQQEKENRDLRAKLAEHTDHLPQPRLLFSDRKQRLEIKHTLFKPMSDAAAKKITETHRKYIEASDRIALAQGFSGVGRERYQRLLDQYFVEYEKYISQRQEAQGQRARTIELEIQLVNEGRAPAEDTDVILDFPPDLSVKVSDEDTDVILDFPPDLSVKVSDEDPGPPVPASPQPPEPTSAILHAFAVLDSLDQLTNPRAPSVPLVPHRNPFERANVTRPKIDATRVQIHVARNKQNQVESLAHLYVSFPNQDLVQSFQINYRIQTANLPEEISGSLAVVVRKTTSEESDDDSHEVVAVKRL